MRVWGDYVRSMTSRCLWGMGGYMVAKKQGWGVLAYTTLDFFSTPRLDTAVLYVLLFLVFVFYNHIDRKL